MGIQPRYTFDDAMKMPAHLVDAFRIITSEVYQVEAERGQGDR